MGASSLVGVGFHDLRRLAATSLVLARVDLKTAQVRLGHSDPRLTLAVYAQATTEADRHAAEVVGRRIARSDLDDVLEATVVDAVARERSSRAARI
ncbi:MAG: tyrosine-type recombinase/integrase [Acidimicrobiales bacterium]